MLHGHHTMCSSELDADILASYVTKAAVQRHFLRIQLGEILIRAQS